MSLSLYESAIAGSPAADGMLLRFANGRAETLDVGRWRSPPDDADRELLRRLTGPVLDIGCGPGRFGAELGSRNIEALGIDISPAAVRIARRRGGRAQRIDVFDDVPGPGTWHDVLLIDGNIGIGGQPTRLLARCRALLAPGGSIHVEVGPPGGATGSGRVRLEAATGPPGGWFWWGWLSDGDAETVCAAAGLTFHGRWSRGDRRFVELRA